MHTRQSTIVGVFLFLTALGTVVLSAPLPPKEIQLRTTLTGHTFVVNWAAFSPDGKILATAGWDKLVKLWDVSNGKEIATLAGHPNRVQMVAFSPDGKLLATCGRDSCLKVWNVAEKKEVSSFPARSEPVEQLAFSKDGKLLASGGGKFVELWDLERNVKRSAHGIKNVVRNSAALVFTPEGKLLAVRSSLAPPYLALWDVLEEKEIMPLAGHTTSVFCVAFSPDCKVLASSTGVDVRIWDLASGKSIATFSYADQITCLTFRADGKILAIGHKEGQLNRAGNIRLIDLTMNKEMAFWKAHDRPIAILPFSPDGNILASPSDDRTIKLWDILPMIRPNK